MKITVQIGKIILESLSHIDGIISARDFTVDAFHAVHQLHPFLRPQDEDDGRHHVAEHAGMGYRAVNDDGIAHDAGPGRITRAGIEDVVVADAILDEIAFVVA